MVLLTDPRDHSLVSSAAGHVESVSVIHSGGVTMIGILAYGSLINDPGSELEAIIADRKAAETPFPIEFARSSDTRGGAPTLVPVEEGGAKVSAIVFVLNPSISEAEAANILWRRETRKIGSGQPYKPPVNPGPNNVLVKQLKDFADLDIVLYTDFATSGKLKDPTPQQLAELAIQSVKNDTIEEGKDGISYLIAAKEAGLVTLLGPEYEKEILCRVNVATLKEALIKLRSNT